MRFASFRCPGSGTVLFSKVSAGLLRFGGEIGSMMHSTVRSSSSAGVISWLV